MYGEDDQSRFGDETGFTAIGNRLPLPAAATMLWIDLVRANSTHTLAAHGN